MLHIAGYQCIWKKDEYSVEMNTSAISENYFRCKMVLHLNVIISIHI